MPQSSPHVPLAATPGAPHVAPHVHALHVNILAERVQVLVQPRQVAAVASVATNAAVVSAAAKAQSWVVPRDEGGEHETRVPHALSWVKFQHFRYHPGSFPVGSVTWVQAAWRGAAVAAVR